MRSAVVLTVFCVLGAAPVAADPTLTASRLDRHRLRVRGAGFSPHGRVVVSADLDRPHASVACFTELTRIALPKSDGRFELVINVDPREGCDFTCGAEPDGWSVTAETVDEQPLATAAAVRCQPARAR